jgi:hypothetical protein
MPDKFNWMLDQCRGSMAWQLKSCFERQGLIWELRDKALLLALAAAVSLIAGYAVYRYREAIEGGMVEWFAGLIQAKRRMGCRLSAMKARISALVDPPPPADTVD